MAYYRLNNLAWVVNTDNCTVRPVAFNKDKTKIRVLGLDKIITLTSANPYDAVCKKFGGCTVYDNYYFFIIIKTFCHLKLEAFYQTYRATFAHQL